MYVLIIVPFRRWVSLKWKLCNQLDCWFHLSIHPAHIYKLISCLLLLLSELLSWMAVLPLHWCVLELLAAYVRNDITTNRNLRACLESSPLPSGKIFLALNSLKRLLINGIFHIQMWCSNQGIPLSRSLKGALDSWVMLQPQSSLHHPLITWITHHSQ